MFLKIHCLLVLMMFAPFACLQAQDDNIPIRPDLERNAEQWLIKIGIINKKKPPKVKFGDFYTEQREGKQASKEQLRFSSPEDTDLSHEFSFTLVNKKKDSVYVEAYSESQADTTGKDIVVYMASNRHPEELWILMLSTLLESNDISVGSMVMTNGSDEVTFSRLTGKPSGKSEQSAPSGIEIYLENLAIGAMQYDSGATFGYRKYIWINRTASEQLQLIGASVFSVLLEVGGYFEKAKIQD